MGSPTSIPVSAVPRLCRGGPKAAVALTAAVVLAGWMVLAGATSAGATRARPSPRRTMHLYWSEPATSRGPSGSGIDTIWSARVNGSGVNPDLVKGLSIPGAVAVAGRHLYWSDDETRAIGRASLDGTHVQRRFIRKPTDALAVTGRHIYFVTTVNFTTGQMWRANLDGSHAHRLFTVGRGNYFGGLAVTGSHLYWSNRDRGSIGRADLDGRHVRRDFITGLKDPNGLAASRTSVYWASTDFDTASDSIGRARLDGTHVNQHLLTGAAYPFGVAVGAGHLYWANYDASSIGRADLDGRHVRQHFIAAHAFYNTAAPLYIAVGP